MINLIKKALLFLKISKPNKTTTNTPQTFVINQYDFKFEIGTPFDKWVDGQEVKFEELWRSIAKKENIIFNFNGCDGIEFFAVVKKCIGYSGYSQYKITGNITKLRPPYKIFGLSIFNRANKSHVVFYSKKFKGGEHQGILNERFTTLIEGFISKIKQEVLDLN